MTKKTLSRCLTTIGMLAFAISMALPAAALEDRALPTYPCPTQISYLVTIHHRTRSAFRAICIGITNLKAFLISRIYISMDTWRCKKFIPSFNRSRHCRSTFWTCLK